MEETAYDRAAKLRLIGLLVALFLLIASVYLLTGRAELTSIDEIYVFRTAASLATNRSLTIEETGGRTTSRFSVIPSAVAAPFYWIADQSLGDVPERDAWRLYFTRLGGCLTIALSAVLLALWLLELGHRLPVAFGTALLYSFGTMVFPYSSTFYVQVVAVPLLLASVWSVASGRAWWSVSCITILVACRNDQVLLLPAFWAAVAADNLGQPWKRRILITLAAILGVTLSGLNSWYRGDPVFHGPYAGETFTTSLLGGLLGLLFSFGKGLIWYSPLSFMGLVGLLPESWRRPNPGRLLLYVISTELLLVAHWWTWHGGMSWGPRLLLPILPLCMLPIASILSSWEKLSPLYRRLFVLLSVASLLVNTWATIQPMVKDPSGIYSDTESIYTESGSPLFAEPDPVSLWIVQAPASSLRTITLSVLTAFALMPAIFCIFIIRPLLRIQRSAVLLWSGMVLLAIAVYLPRMLDLGLDIFTRTAPSQYRQLTRTPSGYEGILRVPNAGIYFFHADSTDPVTIRLGDQVLLTKSRIAPMELHRGDIPITIEGTGPLRWTIPGFASYKAKIPSDYLMSPTPTTWERIRIQWRHLGWVLWIPAVFLLCRWLLLEEDVPKPAEPVERSQADQSQQDPPHE